MTAIRIFYEGHVQGVGFRYTVKQIAKDFEVTGFVRNLRDGKVELQAAGSSDEIAAFREAVSRSELRAHITRQLEEPVISEAGFRGFEIRHE